jgi:hypothetical protein
MVTLKLILGLIVQLLRCYFKLKVLVNLLVYAVVLNTDPMELITLGLDVWAEVLVLFVVNLILTV